MSLSSDTKCQIPKENTKETCLIVEPALDTFSDVSQSYIYRYDGFAPNQTYYIFERPFYANRARIQLEREGYRVNITYPDGTTYSTNAKMYHDGIPI